MPTYTEENFEDHIEKHLNRSGYRSSDPISYDKSHCLMPLEILQFIRDTQSKTYQKLERQYGQDTPQKLLVRISQQIEQRGVLDVLRNGVKDRGCNFKLTYLLPSSGMNPTHQELYSQNRFSLIRQLRYSLQNGNTLDMVLFLNGLPLVTMELKNSLTGQVFTDAEKQYRTDRDPRETLFQFKRCLVHFAVGNEKVSMTTHLKGQDTRFFPFNKGIENPVNPNGHKTAYLWEDILQPDNLMELIQNFIHEQETTEKVYDPRSGEVRDEKRKTLIFPRYHQLDVIRKLKQTVITDGVGGKYLIQHTTGSGKSNSIAWLAHLLTHLYQNPSDNNRIFDSIIVVTDRRLLDKQLQDTIKQVGQVDGVVHAVDKNSAQLREFLESGKSIIVSTIQKFTVIAQTIGELDSKSFAVIIDEAHSSQSGESAKNLRVSLSQGMQNEDQDDDDDLEEASDIDAKILEQMQQRRMQEHISYFGFTGTPKNKTLELFGNKDDEGKFIPFHLYSMRQSISEGYTLDVLQNYTTYKRYFQLIKSVQEDKEYEKSRTLRALTNFVDLQPRSIEEKTRIILTHFTDRTEKTIGGKGRAMLATRSRLHCVKYKIEFDKQMREMQLPYECLVAFSDTIHDTDSDVEYTENSMNNLPPNTSIADAFKSPQYRILIVANKFQTGFDEPMLHTMYVDKKLDGLQCVQTLSRLNRVASGKTDTLVIDFVNDPDRVQKAFQEYYQMTTLAEETDPNLLYDKQSLLESFELYDDHTINEFCQIFYDSQEKEAFQPILDPVVEKWKELERDAREEFRSTLQSYIRLYAYITQLITYSDIDLEKLYIFAHSLNKKLPKREQEDLGDLLSSVDLDSLRIQRTYESLQIPLEPEDTEVDGISSGVGTISEPELEFLSNLIKSLNDAHQTDFTDEDKVDIQTIQQKVNENEELRQVFEGNNTEENKKYKFDEVFEVILLELVNNRLELYNKLSEPEINESIKKLLYGAYRDQMSTTLQTRD